MMTNPREEDFPAKEEGNPNDGKILKASSSLRPWTGLKDPRIVRVSRSFGGKDRHSKVCTIRGLRDRRVRLSVPIAIQLYDLQDRLGLNQPSKVVDWLLDAAKHEIDELPPLQMPLGNFCHYPPLTVVSHEVNAPQSSLVNADTEDAKDEGALSLLSSKGGLKINNNVDGEDQITLPKSTYWNSDAFSKMKYKEVERETIGEKSNWMKRNVKENQEGIHESHSEQVSAHNSCPLGSNSSVSGLQNNTIPYNSYYHWGPSNVSLSHLGYSSQIEDPRNYNVLSLPSSLSLPSGSQLLVCPSGTPPSFFPPYFTTPVERDPRQINHFQMLSPSSQQLLQTSATPSQYSIIPPLKPLFMSTTSNILHSQNNNGSQPDKDISTGASSTQTESFFQTGSRAMTE